MIGMLIDKNTKVVEWDGIKFFRTKSYFKSNSSSKTNYKKIFLHRYIWIKTFKNDISKYHIHHLDRNPLNCLICNLIKLTPKEHRELHKSDKTIMYITKDEWRQRWLQGRQGKIKGKAVEDITTGEVYKSIKEASEKTGVSIYLIKKVITNGKKSQWKFAS